jgi:hypothetical protein
MLRFVAVPPVLWPFLAVLWGFASPFPICFSLKHPLNALFPIMSAVEGKENLTGVQERSSLNVFFEDQLHTLDPN